MYTAIDGRYYKTEKECLKHDNYINEIYKIFNKLIDNGFFATDEILNHSNFQIKIKTFGHPQKREFDFDKLGYIKIHGYQTDDVYIRFKLRKNKIAYADYYSSMVDEHEGLKKNYFLKTIYLDKIFKEEYRNKKIKNICK